jgi:hypothetical protein
MVPDPASQKVTADHVKRNAYLYVRQSTIRQVFENTESTQRQYAPRQRAVALGWPLDRIVVIDDDQGQSGVCAANRKGFQHLVGEVGMGQAGIVLGLEVSRLDVIAARWRFTLTAAAEVGRVGWSGISCPEPVGDVDGLGPRSLQPDIPRSILSSRDSRGRNTPCADNGPSHPPQPP